METPSFVPSITVEAAAALAAVAEPRVAAAVRFTW
jgi:hypothetical protein